MSALEFHFSKRYSLELTISIEGRFDFTEGASVHALFGRSGVGKTTLVRWLAGLLRVEDGELEFDQGTWESTSRSEFLKPQLRRVGYVPQGSHLFPHLTAEQNIAFGLGRVTKDERDERIKAMIDLCGLKNERSKKPKELSGGQKQRVAFARALATRPRLLLLDEPFGALDYESRTELIAQFREWTVQSAIPTLLITHDPRDASALGANLWRLEGGTILATPKAHVAPTIPPSP